MSNALSEQRQSNVVFEAFVAFTTTATYPKQSQHDNDLLSGENGENGVLHFSYSHFRYLESAINLVT